MLHELFRASAESHPSRTAIVDAGGRIAYGPLHQAALDFSRRLTTLGARPGDRVAVQMPNGIEAAIALWGVLEAGCVMVPLHPGLKDQALERQLADADPHLILRAGGRTENLQATHDSDAAHAALLYTSGSTGESRGVVLTHANMTAAIGMVNGYLALGSDDILHSALPLSSSYGLYQLLLGLAAGATVLLDRSFAFPLRSLQFAAREGATAMAAVPTMLAWLASTPLLESHDLGTLRILTSAAAALPPAHGLKVRERLPRVRLFAMYGQTECKRISWLDPDDYARHPDSVGRGLAGQEHRLVDEDGRPVAPGELGELQVRGPHVMQGYWRRPAETARKLRPAADGGRPWLCTGDIFRADQQGLLYFAGRRDEVMKIGGNKVSPAEIENLLCRIPGVLEAAVIGIADERWGEAAAAYVVRSEDSALSADDIRRHCSRELQGFMVPRAVRFLTQLPKTASGKILKRALPR